MRLRPPARFLALVFCAAMPCAALAAPPDIAYDQVERIYVGASAPPLGTFDDLKATLATAGAGDEFPPVPGTLDFGGVSAARRLAAGVLYHYSFLGTMARVDEPATMRATVALPQAGEVLFLDYRTKTYRAITGDDARALLDTTLSEQLKGAFPAPSASPGLLNGSETLTIAATSGSLPSRRFGETEAAGESVDMRLTAGSRTGSCPDIAMTARVEKYVDPAQPERLPEVLFPTDPVEMLKGLPSFGCAITYVRPSPAPEPSSSGGFAYYVRVDNSVTLRQLPAPLSTSAVLQRDHLRHLGPADAALFRIPPGFTPAN